MGKLNSNLRVIDTESFMYKNDKDEVVVAGFVSHIREVKTKNGHIMAYVTLKDMKGAIAVVFFADVYKEAYSLLHNDDPILIRGFVDVDGYDVKLIAARADSYRRAAAMNTETTFIDMLNEMRQRVEACQDIGELRKLQSDLYDVLIEIFSFLVRTEDRAGKRRMYKYGLQNTVTDKIGA